VRCSVIATENIAEFIESTTEGQVRRRVVLRTAEQMLTEYERMLTSAEHAAFAKLIRGALAQYEMDAGDVADHICPLRLNAAERQALEVTAQSQAPCPCLVFDSGVGSTPAARKAMRRRIENALRRPISARVASALVKLLDRSKKADHWRRNHADVPDLLSEAFLNDDEPFLSPNYLEPPSDAGTPGFNIAFHPAAIAPLARHLASAVIAEGNLVKKSLEGGLCATLEAALRDLAPLCNERFVRWFDQGSLIRAADIVEVYPEAPGGDSGFMRYFEKHAYVRNPLKNPVPIDGSRSATPAELLTVMLDECERVNARRTDTKQ
jgi:hypothetical protein